MSWRAIVVGDLHFPDGGVARWKGTAALAVDYDWPEMVAQGLGGVMEEEEEEPSSVGDLLDSVPDGAFGATVIAGEDVDLGYVVDGSLYAALAEHMVRLLSAAAHVGASGRVLFCDGDAAVGSGAFDGALVALREGEMKPEPKNDKLAAGDKKRVDELLERAMAGGRPS